jgi:hypothetical protein
MRKTATTPGESTAGNAVPRKKQDAGLPDTNRRDPHTPGESPALRGPEEVEFFFDLGGSEEN